MRTSQRSAPKSTRSPSLTCHCTSEPRWTALLTNGISSRSFTSASPSHLREKRTIVEESIVVEHANQLIADNPACLRRVAQRSVNIRSATDLRHDPVDV